MWTEEGGRRRRKKEERRENKRKRSKKKKKNNERKEEEETMRFLLLIEPNAPVEVDGFALKRRRFVINDGHSLEVKVTENVTC